MVLVCRVRAICWDAAAVGSDGGRGTMSGLVSGDGGDGVACERGGDGVLVVTASAGSAKGSGGRWWTVVLLGGVS